MLKYLNAIKTSKLLPFLFSLTIIIVAFYLCFYKLGVAFLDDWDEAWYGEMTKQMLRTGEIFVLRWNGKFLFDKPPLYIWISAIFSSIFGLSEWSIRITSAIAGFSTILIAFFYSFKKWGTLPSLLTFVTLALNNIFIWRVRSGNLDALVTFLIFLTFFAILWKNKWRYPVLGLLFTLIFLGKASLVSFPLAIFGISEILYNGKNIIKKPRYYLMHYAIFSILFITPIAIWLFMGKQIAGQKFVEYYLYRSDQGVSHISLDMFKTDYLWHLYYSLQRRFFFAFVFGAVMLIIKLFRREHLLLISYSFFLLFLLSFTERNNNWYLMPSIPFWSLIVGYGTHQILSLFPWKKYSWLAVIVILIPSIYVAQKTFKENIQPIIHTSSSARQVESAIKMKEISQSSEAIIRLDHLYPSTIYYSDRKVFSSPNQTGTGDLFMGRIAAAEKMRNGKLQFAIGKTGDVENFVRENELSGDIIEINDEESYFRVQ